MLTRGWGQRMEFGGLKQPEFISNLLGSTAGWPVDVHSLRAGFLTSAAGRGASIFKMMDVSRHKSVDTLRGYVRDAELFKDHAGAGLLYFASCAATVVARAC